MNRRSKNLMTLKKAITGFVNHKFAEGLTPRSVASYERLLNKWVDQVGDQEISDISPEVIREYLKWLRTEYKPKRLNGKTHPLSPKTIRNIWVTLASFFKWAGREFNIDSPMHNIPAPKYQKKPVEAFTKDEVEAVVKACQYSQKADTAYRMSFTMRRPTAKRDRE